MPFGDVNIQRAPEPNDVPIKARRTGRKKDKSKSKIEQVKYAPLKVAKSASLAPPGKKRKRVEQAVPVKALAAADDHDVYNFEQFTFEQQLRDNESAKKTEPEVLDQESVSTVKKRIDNTTPIGPVTLEVPALKETPREESLEMSFLSSNIREAPRRLFMSAMPDTSQVPDELRASATNDTKTEDESLEEQRLTKLRKCIERYLKKNLVEGPDFASEFTAAVRTNQIRKHPFYDYAKKYLASASRNEFARLTQQAIKELSLGGDHKDVAEEKASTDHVVAQEGDPDADAETRPREEGALTPGGAKISGMPDKAEKSKKTKKSVKPDEVRKTKKTTMSADTMEADMPKKSKKRIKSRDDDETQKSKKRRRLVDPDQLFKSGPLTSDEQKVLSSGVQRYCSDCKLTESQFQDMIWDLPVAMDRDMKRSVYAEFYSLLPDRKPKCIRDYLRRAYAPHERSAFDADDDKEILRLYRQMGADWKSIAETMGRFREDIRDRYRNYIASKPKTTGRWSLEEDMKFDEILAHFANKDEMNWAVIAKQMGTRSRAQCRDHYLRTKQTHETYCVEQVGHPSASKVDRRSLAAVLPGDVLHMLQLLQQRGASSVEAAVAEGAFEAYDGVFKGDVIEMKLGEAFETVRGKSFGKKLSKLLQRYDAMDAKELKRTLVDFDDD